MEKSNFLSIGDGSRHGHRGDECRQFLGPAFVQPGLQKKVQDDAAGVQGKKLKLNHAPNEIPLSRPHPNPVESLGDPSPPAVPAVPEYGSPAGFPVALEQRTDPPASSVENLHHRVKLRFPKSDSRP